MSNSKYSDLDDFLYYDILNNILNRQNYNYENAVNVSDYPEGVCAHHILDECKFYNYNTDVNTCAKYHIHKNIIREVGLYLINNIGRLRFELCNRRQCDGGKYCNRLHKSEKQNVSNIFYNYVVNNVVNNVKTICVENSQLMIEEFKNNSKEKANNMIMEAKEEANNMIMEAKEEANNIVVEAEEEANDIITETEEQKNNIIIEAKEKAKSIIEKAENKIGDPKFKEEYKLNIIKYKEQAEKEYKLIIDKAKEQAETESKLIILLAKRKANNKANKLSELEITVSEEETQLEDIGVYISKVDDPKVDNPKVDDPKVDDPKVDDTKVEELQPEDIEIENLRQHLQTLEMYRNTRLAFMAKISIFTDMSKMYNGFALQMNKIQNEYNELFHEFTYFPQKYRLLINNDATLLHKVYDITRVISNNNDVYELIESFDKSDTLTNVFDNKSKTWAINQYIKWKIDKQGNCTPEIK
jgi:vacuolar-type H+-ATPase subunit H